MILVDTTIWVDHFGKADPTLGELLADGAVLAHPFIIGEIALGNIPRRERTLGAMHDLPKAISASASELAPFIERRLLFGVGIGYVDAHLLMSTVLTPDAMLWTRDKRLHAMALRLDIAADLG